MSKTPLPFTTLNAVTAVTTGVVKDLEGAFQTHTLIVHVTGSPTSWAVEFLGSHDGINWAGGGPYLDQTIGATGYQTTNFHLYRYVRADLISFGGGSSPTLTATIASA
jgi:hypothetical protein